MMSLHINRPSSTRFVARVRWPGFQRYTVLGKPTKSYAVALKRMVTAFASGNYKRVMEHLPADCYDPTVIAEIVKR